MKLDKYEDFFLSASLYEKYIIEEIDNQFLFELLYFVKKIDCYCPSCKKESTFSGVNKRPSITQYNQASSFLDFQTGKEIILNSIIPVNFTCGRDSNHKMQHIIHISDKEISKIGQYPSLAEISQPELKKYSKVLTKEKYKELNRGIGLVTHGIGIGSFVYLRRIFEDLIEEAHQILNKLDNWDEDIYSKSRMGEKIEILKTELPDFLVENKSLYGILSKGIHELSEKDCLDFFPTVKLGIELILDEKLEQKRKADKIKKAKQSIESLKTKLTD
jgi:hypothetical protein